MDNKGFTLIELLTVIAIIAILSAITLVTFPMAQDRAADARTINAMQQLRTAAEASYGAYGSYAQVMDGGDATVDTLIDEIVANATSYTLFRDADNGGYCAEAVLKAGGRRWCIDSDMYSDYVTGAQCAAAGDRCE